MDKAGKVLRRSGVRLKNINSAHGDLHMVISDLTEVRSLYKSLISAQSLVWEDLLKWAGKERNFIIQESLVHFSHLHALWLEVQKEFVVNLKKFKHQFEMILEGEQHIDKSRNHLKTCEQKEAKIKKEIKQCNSKGTVDSVRILDEKLNESREQVKAAQAEVSSKVDDLEVMKMVMMKDGLNSLSDYYVEMSEKAVIVFEAHKRISEGLPDIKDQEIHNLKYSNNELAKKTVINTRENILCYRKSSSKVIPSAPNSPPPYSSSPIPIGFNTSIQPNPSTSFTSYPYQNVQGPSSLNQTDQERIGFAGCLSPPEYSEHPGAHRYDLPPRELYENIDGSFGDMSVEEQRQSSGNQQPQHAGWRLDS